MRIYGIVTILLLESANSQKTPSPSSIKDFLLYAYSVKDKLHTALQDVKNFELDILKGLNNGQSIEDDQDISYAVKEFVQNKANSEPQKQVKIDENEKYRHPIIVENSVGHRSIIYKQKQPKNDPITELRYDSFSETPFEQSPFAENPFVDDVNDELNFGFQTRSGVRNKKTTSKNDLFDDINLPNIENFGTEIVNPQNSVTHEIRGDTGCLGSDANWLAIQSKIRANNAHFGSEAELNYRVFRNCLRTLPAIFDIEIVFIIFYSK